MILVCSKRPFVGQRQSGPAGAEPQGILAERLCEGNLVVACSPEVGDACLLPVASRAVEPARGLEFRQAGRVGDYEALTLGR